jgi:hypothetical protein
MFCTFGLLPVKIERASYFGSPQAIPHLLVAKSLTRSNITYQKNIQTNFLAQTLKKLIIDDQCEMIEINFLNPSPQRRLPDGLKTIVGVGSVPEGVTQLWRLARYRGCTVRCQVLFLQ